MERKKDSGYTSIIRQSFVTGSVATNFFGHGCVIGFSAILIPSLRLPESHIHATPSEESWIASIVGFALIAGNFITTMILDALGRKKSHLLTIFPILIGWFMLLLVNSAAGLIAARFLQGLSMGMIGPLGTVMVGEMTNPKYRGMFISSVTLSATTGVLFSHILGSYFGWQQAALICSFTTFTSLLFIIYAPESPYWLIAKGRYDEGRSVFFWLRGYGEEQETELERMIAANKIIRKSSITSQEMSMKVKVKRFFRRFNESCRKPEFYKPILIMLCLYTMFQFAGMNVINSYTTDIIEEVVGPQANAKLLMVALDVERIICNILAVYLMKTMKRRTLLFSTGFVCILTYFSKAGYVYLKQTNQLPFDSQWVPIGLIALYMFSLTVGISSVPFALSGEIFSMEYRGLGSGISILALSLNFFIAVKCFPVLKLSIGLSLTYFIYASIVLILMIFVWFWLPETKDRTLQEIEDIFRGHSPDDVRSVQPLTGSMKK